MCIYTHSSSLSMCCHIYVHTYIHNYITYTYICKEQVFLLSGPCMEIQRTHVTCYRSNVSFILIFQSPSEVDTTIISIFQIR